MGNFVWLNVLIFVVAFVAVYAGQFCWDYTENETKWCYYGCCGYMNHDCCDADVALIVGLTVLSVLVVCGVITIVCCCVRRRGSLGQVLNPPPGPGTSLVTASASHTTYAQGAAYPTQSYMPGAYAAPPPYSAVMPSALPTVPYPGAVPQAPPPYSQVVQQGIDNQGFKEPN